MISEGSTRACCVQDGLPSLCALGRDGFAVCMTISHFVRTQGFADEIRFAHVVQSLRLARPSPIDYRGAAVERYELLDRREQLLPCPQPGQASTL